MALRTDDFTIHKLVDSFEIGNNVVFCSDFCVLVLPNFASPLSLFTSVVGCTRAERSLVYSLSEVKMESEDKLANFEVNLIFLFGEAIVF